MITTPDFEKSIETLITKKFCSTLDKCEIEAIIRGVMTPFILDASPVVREVASEIFRELLERLK